MSVALPGRFVWYDIMTTDPKASVDFYTRLFGWKTSEMDMGPMGKYTMIHVGEAKPESGIGGFMPLDKSHGVPSHWMPYVSVPDVDAVSARVAKLGGQACVPPTDIPNIGRFSVITDPAGAAISPYKGQRPDEEPAGPLGVGHVFWNELVTTDPEAATRFYSEVFAWTPTSMDMGPMGTYWVFKRGGTSGKDAAGMMKMPPGAKGRPQWVSYVSVADVDASTAKAKELGATVHMPPSDIPNIGRFSVLADPTGATFALYKPAK